MLGKLVLEEVGLHMFQKAQVNVESIMYWVDYGENLITC